MYIQGPLFAMSQPDLYAVDSAIPTLIYRGLSAVQVPLPGLYASLSTKKVSDVILEGAAQKGKAHETFFRELAGIFSMYGYVRLHVN